MKIENANISILVSKEITRIEIMDADANNIFCRVELTPEQLSACLSRQAHVECNTTVHNLDRVGKKMIHKRHEFEIPDNIAYGERTEFITNEIKKTLPDGWVSDNYFSSQDTFSKKGDKTYAQTTIRKWVDKNENN